MKGVAGTVKATHLTHPLYFPIDTHQHILSFLNNLLPFLHSLFIYFHFFLHCLFTSLSSHFPSPFLLELHWPAYLLAYLLAHLPTTKYICLHYLPVYLHTYTYWLVSYTCASIPTYFHTYMHSLNHNILPNCQSFLPISLFCSYSFVPSIHLVTPFHSYVPVPLPTYLPTHSPTLS